MNPSISVIIPIYNASKYLRRCLTSVVNQTFEDFELILVNDGSIDNSLQICEEFRKEDKRVFIIDQSNKGVSESRQVGFNLSKGDYIINIDADDWMEPNMLFELYTVAEAHDADIIECGVYIDSADGHTSIFKHPYSQEVGQKILRIHMGYSALWNKLIKRKLYTDYDIKGVRGITMWEDNLITMKIRYHSKNTICLDKPLYHYWVGEGVSMCDSLRSEFPSSEIRVAEMLSDYFGNLSPHDKLVKRCIANIRVLAKENIWKHDDWGGVKEWKLILPISNIQIWLSQINVTKKIFFSLLNILPPRISNNLIKLISRKITK